MSKIETVQVSVACDGTSRTQDQQSTLHPPSRSHWPSILTNLTSPATLLLTTLTTMVPVALFRFTGLFRIFLEFIPFTTPLSNDTFTFMIKMSGSHSYTFFLNFHCVNIFFWYLYECMKFMRSIFGGHHLFVGVSVIFKKQF